MADEQKDLKPDEEQSPSNPPEADGGLKNEEQKDTASDNLDEMVDELLSDHTSKSKKVGIQYDKFVEINEKAKLYDEILPALANLRNNETATPSEPEEGKEEVETPVYDKRVDSLTKRLQFLEDEKRTQKIQETRTVVKEALALWPDMAKHWKTMQPIISLWERQGVSYADAVQRAYFSANPQAAVSAERLVNYERAAAIQNTRGVFSSSSSVATRVVPQKEEEFSLSEQDRIFALKAGIPEELYKKHYKWMEEKGLLNL